MSDFEDQLREMLTVAAGEPPRAIDPQAVRARARRQRRRFRLVVSAGAAMAVAAAVTILVGLTGSPSHPITVETQSGPSATVTASPSDQLANGQTIRVMVRGFPADQKVSLAECPGSIPFRGVSCSSAPVSGVLTTNRAGSGSGILAVIYGSGELQKVFGNPKCVPGCLLVATSETSPAGVAVTATTTLSFASRLACPPAPGPRPEPPGFDVAAASFINSHQGWALGSTGCDGCVGVATTLDGGKTWTYLRSPPTTFSVYSSLPSAVTDIDFANASDGYLFVPGLFASTDGGRTWTDEHLTDIRTLTVDGSYVYALSGYNGTGPEQLYRSRLGSNNWQKMAVPGVPPSGQTFETAAAGPDLVLLEQGSSMPAISGGQVGQLWISSDQGAEWQPRSVPCTDADGGAAVLSVAYGHPQAWLLLCFDNEQSSQAQNTLQHLYGTTNGGLTWIRLGDPPQHNGPDLLADNGAGHAFLATEGGGGDTLNGTLDGARTWTVQLSDGGSFYGWADLQFVSTTTGFVVGPTHYAPEHLYRTTDGGQTWTPLVVAP